MPNRHLKCLGHGVGRNIIMGGANAACGEHIGVARPQGIHGGNNIIFVIGHAARFLEINAKAHQIIRDEPQVLVLGAPGQYFIANQQYGSSGSRCHHNLNQQLDICHRFGPLSKPCTSKAPSPAEN